jgi:hypothetical protein
MKLKNIGNLEVQELVNHCIRFPMLSMEERAKISLELLRQAGLYRPLS